MVCFIEYCLVKGNKAMANELSLLVSTDKQDYRIGDEIKIKSSLVNDSEKNMTILPWGGAYVFWWISIYNLDREKVNSMISTFYELKFIPDKQDFVTLKSGERFDLEYVGKIKAKDDYYATKQNYNGILINFDDSAYLIKSLGRFTIKGVYETKEKWAETADNLSINDFWSGTIESEEIEITIQEE